jgi:hypothetical protein
VERGWGQGQEATIGMNGHRALVSLMFTAEDGGKPGVLRPGPRPSWATAQVLPEQSLCSAVAPEGALAACRQVGREWELSSESPTNPAQLPTVLPPSSPHTGASPGLAILLVVEW